MIRVLGRAKQSQGALGSCAHDQSAGLDKTVARCAWLVHCVALKDAHGHCWAGPNSFKVRLANALYGSWNVLMIRLLG